jgi:hypothetical protein
MLCIVHLITAQTVWMSDIPAPASSRVALLKAFPSTSGLRQTASWVREWEKEDPGAALSMAQWAGRHAELPWFYVRLEADLLLRQGRQAEAEALYARAGHMEAEAYRYMPQRTSRSPE